MLVIGSIPISLFVCWTIYSLEDASDSSFDKKLMENWNCFKWIAYGVSGTWNKFVEIATWKPKSGIDKEIAEEEKEIAELERQKEKIDELAELKRRKERLFKDVHEETSSDNWICPQCRREFKDLEGLNNHRAWEHRP